MVEPQSRKALAHHYIDALDRAQVPDELLQWWTQKEDQRFCSARLKAGHGQLPLPIRQIALRFFSDLDLGLRHCGPPSQSWEAAALLDLGSTSLDSTCPEKIFALAAASWLVCVKMTFSNRSYLQDLAADVAAATSQAVHAYGGKHVESSAIVQEELRLLEATSWNVCNPTAPMWLSAFTTRFDVLTSGKLRSALAGIRERSLHCAAAAVWQAPLTPQFRPKIVALGAFILALVSTGLLHTSASKVSRSTLLITLQIATDVDASLLQRAAEDVANLLREGSPNVPAPEDIANALRLPVVDENKENEALNNDGCFPPTQDKVYMRDVLMFEFNQI